MEDAIVAVEGLGWTFVEPFFIRDALGQASGLIQIAQALLHQCARAPAAGVGQAT